MGTFISFLLLAIFFVIIGRVAEKDSDEQKPIETENNFYDISETVSFVSTLEQARVVKEKHELRKKIESLKRDIRNEIENLERETDPELKLANNFIINELKTLLDKDVRNENDYEYLSWRYNYGNLRTSNEKMEQARREAAKEYKESGQMEKDIRNDKIHGFFAPFILALILGFVILASLIGCLDYGDWIVCLFLASIPATVAGLIGLAVSTDVSTKRAMDIGVPANDKRIKEEKAKQTALTISLVAGAASNIKHAEKGLKDLENVDNWKQMK